MDTGIFRTARQIAVALVSCALLPCGLVHAQSVDIEAAKLEAQAWAYGMQGGAQLDANGGVLLNEDGSIRMGPASGEQSQSQQALMQELTGISSYQTIADPAAQSGAAGASSRLSGHVDIACSRSAGSTVSAAGHVFKFHGCRVEDGRVTEIALQLCSRLQMGELCEASDFSDLAYYPADQYSTIDGVSIGVGCSDDRVCRVSVDGSFSLATSGEDLAEQAESRDGGGGLRRSVQGMMESPGYEEAVNGQRDLRECYAGNEASFLADGEVTTCDGQTRVALAGGPAGNAASCTPDRVCTEETTETRSFATSCTRSFGSLTTNRCTLQYKTLQCVEYQDAGDAQSLGLANSCATEDLEGATELSRTELTCRFTIAIWGIRVCLVHGADVSYVYYDDYEYTDCQASPAPLAGPFGPDTCDMSAPSREILSCSTDGWFGRSLPDNQCTETVTRDDGSTYTRYLDNSEKPGCGVCTDAARVGFTCRAAPTADDIIGSCADTNLSGCALTHVDPPLQEGGFVLSQREHYSCQRETTMCTAWQTVEGSCPNIDASYGVDQLPFDEVGDQGAFEQAMTTAGVASELATAAASGTSFDPLLFGGQALTCERPAGGWLSDAAQNDCCKIGLSKTGGSRLGNQCNEDEVRLAAARRNNFVHYVGSYCSKDTLFGKCIRRAEVYCVFDGVLPRLVQEQGREQLSDAASSSFGSTQTRQLNFAYYAGNGGWTPALAVNGRQVSVYQAPAHCSDPQAAAVAMAQGAEPCSASLGLWFAACNESGSCGPLPADPEGGSAKWQLVQVDPLRSIQSPLTRYVSVQGACDTQAGQCQYAVSALPDGVAGRAVIAEDLTFSIRATAAGSSYQTAINGQIETVQDGAHTVVLGQTLVRVTPAVHTDLGPLPTSVPAAISFNGGNSWASFALPTSIASEFSIPDASINVTGGCAQATGQCSYRFTGSVRLQPKPWGGAGNPDCSGFSLEELSALDFSKMDLSEWTQDIGSEVPSESELNAQVRQLAAQAETQAGRTNGAPTGDPSGQVASVKPSQGIGPFTVRLTVGATWPALGHEAIYGGQVDWGDGSTPDNLVSTSNGFYREHTYGSPETPGIRDRHGRTGPVRETLEHLVTVTLNTESGTRRVTLDVRNVF